MPGAPHATFEQCFILGVRGRWKLIDLSGGNLRGSRVAVATARHRFLRRRRPPAAHRA